MSMAVAGKSNGPRAEINVTPMIDVLLVLIIIFMVITPLVPKGLETVVPQQSNQQPDPEPAHQPVVVEVRSDRSIAINTQLTTLETLRQRLQEIFKSRGERVVFVSGAPELDFEAVATVVDAIRGAGIDRIALMTPQK
ncbi:MAG: ExbD/TolR family protein [Bryobacteraceae bacterium]